MRESGVRSFLNPQNGVFLRIETAEETYYMSAAEDAVTKEIYENVRNMKQFGASSVTGGQ